MHNVFKILRIESVSDLSFVTIPLVMKYKTPNSLIENKLGRFSCHGFQLGELKVCFKDFMMFLKSLDELRVDCSKGQLFAKKVSKTSTKTSKPEKHVTFIVISRANLESIFFTV